METDMDKTSEKIIDATMELILECGYAAATTKDIAVRAGVNECTIFRKFGEKKEIVVEGMKLPRWHPNIKKDTFPEIYAPTSRCLWKTICAKLLPNL